MAFFKSAGDGEVSFAPDQKGGFSSFFRPLTRFAQKVQSRQFEKQLVFNIKKNLPGSSSQSVSMLEEAEADAPEANWWSGGREAFSMEQQFARSSSEELVEGGDAVSDTDDILVEVDGLSEAAQSIEPAASTAASSAAVPAAGTGTAQKASLKDKADKAAGAEGRSKNVVKGVPRSSEAEGSKPAKSKGEKKEKKEKKEGKEKKEKKEKKAKKELQPSGGAAASSSSAAAAVPAPVALGRAVDPFADSDSEKETVVRGPQKALPAVDPFADSDSETGGPRASAIGRPAAKTAPSKKGAQRDPFADSDDDEPQVASAAAKAAAGKAAARGASASAAAAAPKKAAAASTVGRHLWPAAVDSDSDGGF